MKEPKTEYIIPDDLSKFNFELIEERHKAWTNRFLSHHWKQFKFELNTLFWALWWYLELKFRKIMDWIQGI